MVGTSFFCSLVPQLVRIVVRQPGKESLTDSNYSASAVSGMSDADVAEPAVEVPLSSTLEEEVAVQAEEELSKEQVPSVEVTCEPVHSGPEENPGEEGTAQAVEVGDESPEESLHSPPSEEPSSEESPSEAGEAPRATLHSNGEKPIDVPTDEPVDRATVPSDSDVPKEAGTEHVQEVTGPTADTTSEETTQESSEMRVNPLFKHQKLEGLMAKRPKAEELQQQGIPVEVLSDEF